MYIIGAGMAGLLAGAIYNDAIILEAGTELPNNHQAVFRMHSNRIGHYLGIPFDQITVYKAIWFEGQERQITPRLAHYYSHKVTGQISQRSIFNIDNPVTRWVPPENFIQQLFDRCKNKIQFNTHVVAITPNNIYKRGAPDEPLDRKNQPIISTVPMPVLIKTFPDTDMDELPEFISTPIFINRIEIDNCNSYVTIYYPDPFFSVYRATIDQNILITEGIKPMSAAEFEEVKNSFGILQSSTNIKFKNSVHQTQKILPINNEYRQRMIYNATVGYGVYSLGRYATWRPGILLDDIFNDIFVIKKLLTQDQYTVRKHLQGDPTNDTKSKIDQLHP